MKENRDTLRLAKRGAALRARVRGDGDVYNAGGDEVTKEEHTDFFIGSLSGRDKELFDAFAAGFLASGEGFNGEYCRQSSPPARMANADWRDHVAREIQQPFLLWLANRTR